MKHFSTVIKFCLDAPFISDLQYTVTIMIRLNKYSSESGVSAQIEYKTGNSSHICSHVNGDKKLTL